LKDPFTPSKLSPRDDLKRDNKWKTYVGVREHDQVTNFKARESSVKQNRKFTQ
jgi:hypothetical protein